MIKSQVLVVYSDSILEKIKEILSYNDKVNVSITTYSV